MIIEARWYIVWLKGKATRHPEVISIDPTKRLGPFPVNPDLDVVTEFCLN